MAAKPAGSFRDKSVAQNSGLIDGIMKTSKTTRTGSGGKSKLPATPNESKALAGALRDGRRNEIRELFESVYVKNKWHIIRMNFLRGIAFGLGTLIGGTIVVAVVAWILSQTIDLFPWARDFTQRLIDSLQR